MALQKNWVHFSHHVVTRLEGICPGFFDLVKVVEICTLFQKTDSTLEPHMPEKLYVWTRYSPKFWLDLLHQNSNQKRSLSWNFKVQTLSNFFPVHFLPKYSDGPKIKETTAFDITEFSKAFLSTFNCLAFSVMTSKYSVTPSLAVGFFLKERSIFLFIGLLKVQRVDWRQTW